MSTEGSCIGPISTWFLPEMEYGISIWDLKIQRFSSSCGGSGTYSWFPTRIAYWILVSKGRKSLDSSVLFALEATVEGDGLLSWRKNVFFKRVYEWQ